MPNLKPQIPQISQIRGEGQAVSNGARDNGARDRSRWQKEKSSHGGLSRAMGGCLIQCATSKANKMKTSSSLSEQVLSDRNTFSTRTLASRREQADAGLNQLTPTLAAEMALNNARYRDKFGFPFIICARLNNTGRVWQSPMRVNIRHKVNPKGGDAFRAIRRGTFRRVLATWA